MTSSNTLHTYKLDVVFQGDSVIHQGPGYKEIWSRQKIIGSGGFGVVLLEQEHTSGKLRAVKVLRKSQSGVATAELAVLAEISNQSIYFVNFLGYFEDRDCHYIAMEYIEYGNLADYIKQHQGTIDTQAITWQLLSGLVQLHDQKICHRDLKPSNVLITSLSPIWVKIMDFGHAKIAAGTGLRTMVGTQGYIAPELLRLVPRSIVGGSFYTNAVDLWSLGVVVHLMLCSEIPFIETYEELDDESGFPLADSQLDIGALYQYCQGGSEFPVEVLHRSGVSIDGIKFVTSLLTPDPRVRPTAAEALQSDWLIDWRPDAVSIGQASAADPASKSIPPGTPPAPVNKKIEVPPAPANQNSQAELEAAASTGDVGRIKPLVQNGAKVNWAAANENSQTALHAAASGGHLDAIKVLLDLGANVNGASASDYGQTALHAAAGGGHLHAIQLLVQLGAKIDASSTSKYGQTALHAAASAGHLDAIQMLLDMKANPHGASASQYGQTALHAAAAGGHLAAIKMLAGTGVNVDASSASENSQSALHAAAASGNLGAMKLLLTDGANINAASPSLNGQSALHAAAAGGHLGAIQWLFSSGAKINGASTGPNGQTALHAAAGGGHLDAIKLLLELGADVNGASGSKNGQTALHAAAGGGHLEAIELLLEKGASVNTSAASENSQSALHAAATGGQLRALTLLLDKGAEIDGASGGPRGQTALHGAAGQGHIDTIKLLLDRGASVHERDHSVGHDPSISKLLDGQ